MTFSPDISIIIPVWNEGSTINPTLSHLKQQSFHRHIEVIVADAHPDSTTLQAIDIRPSSHFEIKRDRPQKGRGLQMNSGAQLAKSPVLLFLHADTLLPPGAFDAILTVLQNPNLVGGAFDLHIRSARRAYRVIETVGSIRSRLTRLPYGDQAIFIRTSYFNLIGGFSPFPLMEDVDLMQRIKKRGDRIRIISKPVLTDPRRWEKEGLIYGTLRNWTLMILFLAGVSPHRLVKWYR